MKKKVLENRKSSNKKKSAKNSPRQFKSSLKKTKLNPGLYITSTPIGNLGDLSFRAVEVLSTASLIVSENSIHSRKLLNHYGIKNKLLPYNDHNDSRVRPKLLGYLKNDMSIALISDAGTPLISDPGYRLVNESRKLGINIHSIPGPSALTAALATAALPCNNFVFIGFLPPKKTARQKYINKYAKIEASLVFFESPLRIAQLMKELESILGKSRDGAICRELTKIHEEVITGKIEFLSQLTSKRKLKGEIVVIIAPPEPHIVKRCNPIKLLEKALKTQKPGKAASQIASETNIPRRDLYKLALQINAKPFKNK